MFGTSSFILQYYISSISPGPLKKSLYVFYTPFVGWNLVTKILVTISGGRRGVSTGGSSWKEDRHTSHTGPVSVYRLHSLHWSVSTGVSQVVWCRSPLFRRPSRVHGSLRHPNHLSSSRPQPRSQVSLSIRIPSFVVTSSSCPHTLTGRFLWIKSYWCLLDRTVICYILGSWLVTVDVLVLPGMVHGSVVGHYLLCLSFWEHVQCLFFRLWIPTFSKFALFWRSINWPL